MPPVKVRPVMEIAVPDLLATSLAPLIEMPPNRRPESVIEPVMVLPLTVMPADVMVPEFAISVTVLLLMQMPETVPLLLGLVLQAAKAGGVPPPIKIAATELDASNKRSDARRTARLPALARSSVE